MQNMKSFYLLAYQTNFKCTQCKHRRCERKVKGVHVMYYNYRIMTYDVIIFKVQISVFMHNLP